MSEITKNHDNLINRSAQVLRAIRKFERLTQYEMSVILGVTQGAISKIENDVLELSSYQWALICRKYKVPVDTLFTGTVDFLGRTQVELEDGIPRIGSFKIPPRYSRTMGQAVRNILPILRFYEGQTSSQELKEFLDSLKMDPDYFTILSNPLNLNFVQDMLEGMKAKGLFKTEHPAAEIWEKSDFERDNAFVLEQIGPAKGKKSARQYLAKINQMYQIDTHFEMSSEEPQSIGLRAADHLSRLELTPEFLAFWEEYQALSIKKAFAYFKI